MSATQPNPRSPKQQAASRANGAASRGPATPEGKARASSNALKHGAYAARPAFLTQNEDAAAFHHLHQELLAEHLPQTATEALLVERMAIAAFQLQQLLAYRAEHITRRAEAVSAKLTPIQRDSQAYGALAVQTVIPDHLIRAESHLDRIFNRALRQLLALRKERRLQQQAEEKAAARTTPQHHQDPRPIATPVQNEPEPAPIPYLQQPAQPPAAPPSPPLSTLLDTAM